MEEKIEKLIELAGLRDRYQTIILLLTVMIWINVDIIPISLPFLEKTPEVSYIDQDGRVVHAPLNYSLCEMELQKEIQYNITKTYMSSWVIEYGVYCNQVVTGLIGSVCFLGSFISSFLFQYAATHFGRKNTVIVNLVGFCLILAVFYYSQSLTAVMIFIFIAQLTPGSVCLGSYMLCVESVSFERRSLFGAIINSGFCICGIVYILLYRYLDNWRIVFLISSLTTFLCGLVYLLYAVESPRYYISRGNVKGFINALSQIAKSNGKLKEFNEHIKTMEYKSIVDELYTHFGKETSEYVDKEVTKTLLNNSQTGIEVKNRPPSPFALIKYSSQRYNFLISCFLWFCVSGNYYGLTIYLKNLPGDIYFNGILIYLFEMVSYFFSGFIINIQGVGRKGAIFVYYLISVIGYFLLLLNIPDAYILILTFSTRFSVAGIFNILYAYSCEIYPTALRAQGFGYNSAFGKIGSIIFPLLIEIFAQYMNLLFVAINSICFCLMFFMPETLNKPLKDNIPETEEKFNIDHEIKKEVH